MRPPLHEYLNTEETKDSSSALGCMIAMFSRFTGVFEVMGANGKFCFCENLAPSGIDAHWMFPALVSSTFFLEALAFGECSGFQKG